MIKILIAMMLAGNGTGKTLVRSQPGTVVPSGPSNAALAEFPFSTPGCYPTGSAMGTRGQTITVSRAGTRFCNVNGSYLTCQANEACVESEGLLIEPARANLITQPYFQDPTAWGTTNATIVKNQGVAPDGTNTAAVVTALATGAATSADATVAAASAVACAHFKKGSGANDANVLHIRNVSTGTNVLSGRVNLDTGDVTYLAGSTGIVTKAMANGWWRACGNITLTSGQIIRVGAGFGGWAETPGKWSYVWGASLEAAGYGATIPIAASRLADAVAVANPLAVANPPAWCIAGTYKPEWGRAWDGAGNVNLLSSGTDGTNNSIKAYVPGDTRIWFDVYDTVAVKQFYVTHGFAGGSSHRIALGDSSGTLSQSYDGTAKAGTLSGVGSGNIVTPFATILLGASSSANREFGGWISDFLVTRGACR